MPVSKKRKNSRKIAKRYYINRYNTSKKNKFINKESKELLIETKNDVIQKIDLDVEEYYKENLRDINSYTNEIIINVDAMMSRFKELENNTDEDLILDDVREIINSYNESVSEVIQTMGILFRNVIGFIEEVSYMRFKECITDVREMLRGELLNDINVFTYNIFMETLEHKVKANRHILRRKYVELHKQEIDYLGEYFAIHYNTISEKLFDVVEEHITTDLEGKCKSKDFKSRNWKELNKLAEKNGFVHVRDNGDHGIFVNSKEDKTIIIPQGRDIGKGLQIKILKTIEL